VKPDGKQASICRYAHLLVSYKKPEIGNQFVLVFLGASHNTMSNINNAF